MDRLLQHEQLLLKTIYGDNLLEDFCDTGQWSGKKMSFICIPKYNKEAGNKEQLF